MPSLLAEAFIVYESAGDLQLIAVAIIIISLTSTRHKVAIHYVLKHTVKRNEFSTVMNFFLIFFLKGRK